MAQSTYTVRILVVRAWTELAPLRAALRDLGYAVSISAVDIEPALNAALAHATFDVVIYDPSTPGIAHETLVARMREHGRNIPVVELGSLDGVADQILRALARRRN